MKFASAAEKRAYYQSRKGYKGQLAKSVETRIVNKAVRKANAEDPHYWDTNLIDTSIGNAAAPYAFRFCAVPQDDTQKGRSGKKIQLLSIQLAGNAYRNPSSATHDRIRLLLVQIKNENATTYSFTDVIKTNATPANDVQGFRRYDAGNAENFKVIKDWVIDLGYTNSDKGTRLISYYKKFKKPINIWYPSTATGNPVVNSFALFAISDTTANNPLLGMSARITFAP